MIALLKQFGAWAAAHWLGIAQFSLMLIVSILLWGIIDQRKTVPDYGERIDAVVNELANNSNSINELVGKQSEASGIIGRLEQRVEGFKVESAKTNGIINIARDANGSTEEIIERVIRRGEAAGYRVEAVQNME